MAPRRHCFDERLLDQVDLLVSVRAFLAQLDRYEPMEVRVLEPQRKTAAATRAARLALSPPLTEQELTDPQRQPLFADPLRAFKQERLRQPAGGDGACQPVADPLMAIQGVQRHGGMYWGVLCRRDIVEAKLFAHMEL